MDTLMHVLQVIASGFAKRMKIDFPDAVELFVRQKRFGQKSGAGFYRYETDPKGRPQKRVDPQTAQLLANIQPSGLRSFDDEELPERCDTYASLGPLYTPTDGMRAAAKAGTGPYSGTV
jgi:3-hydroxyacyl-CoA dehydrogenase/enoyl-CoA hydratase/3-hydroxybutyryl-CoA epimerase/enoyl-CoA isomerase